MRQVPLQRHPSAGGRDVLRIEDPKQFLKPSQYISGSLLIVTLIMVSFGLVMLFSASMSDGYASQAGNSMYYVLRQASITAVGLIIALILALMVPIRFLDHYAFSVMLYLLTTGLLIYVRFFGVVINQARRWVNLGVMFQPSELAKLAIVFCFAGYMAHVGRRRKQGRLHFRSGLLQLIADGWIDILFPGLLMLVWIFLVAWQPHLSGALILAFVGIVVFLIAGIPLRSWVSAITQLLVVTTLVLLMASVLLPLLPVDDVQDQMQQNFAHVTRRLDIYSNPEEADADATYQVDQSIIAIGSGGLSGLGLGEGRQKYNYLPEAHNDFVFAIIGEELGFIGALMVIILFILFMIIGLSITFRANINFAMILAGGYTMLITLQALLNIGVATRLLPPTGISLPFFSYGGTSNLFFLLAIGLILSVSRTGRETQKPALMRARGNRKPKARVDSLQERRNQGQRERALR